MTAAATISISCDDHLWPLREQILAMQRLFGRLFAAENWVMAYKALCRIDCLGRRLAKETLALVESGRNFLDARASNQPTPVTPSAEQLHAAFTAGLPDFNLELAAKGRRPATLRSVLAVYEDELGPELIADILAIDDRLAPHPSG